MTGASLHMDETWHDRQVTYGVDCRDLPTGDYRCNTRGSPAGSLWLPIESIWTHLVDPLIFSLATHCL